MYPNVAQMGTIDFSIESKRFHYVLYPYGSPTAILVLPVNKLAHISFVLRRRHRSTCVGGF